MLGSIYCFTNLINNKKYIGSTVLEPKKRYNQHLYNANHKDAHQYNYPLYCAIRKYGIENFSFEILEQKECSEQDLRKLEKEYLIKYNCLSPNGYNQTLDTEHPINDPKTYEKIRETKREKAQKVAEIDENNNILHIYRSIIDCAEETNLAERHIAACCRGERHHTNERHFCWIDNNNQLIIPQYIGYQYKGQAGTTQIQSTSKKVQKLDLNTGEILATYDTIALAARENHCDPSAITKVCKGIRHKCGNYGWRYVI